jgi:hypothetical protein
MITGGIAAPAGGNCRPLGYAVQIREHQTFWGIIQDLANMSHVPSGPGQCHLA